MNKYYYQLEVKPSRYYELFLDLIIELMEDAIEEDHGTIIIRSEEDLSVIKEGIEAFHQELQSALDIQFKCQIKVEKKENKDWVLEYQNSVQPIEVGSFYITPSWNELKRKDEKIIIKIDPTLSFGSGHHESTNGCLLAIDKYTRIDQSLCDVGCGSGILAIAAGKKGALVDICDTDEIALKDSLQNFKLNKIASNRNWVGSINKSSAKYDIVVANIVADILVMLAADLIGAVKLGGKLILSGIMEQYAKKVLTKYENKCELIEEIAQNEWRTFVFKKIKD